MSKRDVAEPAREKLKVGQFTSRKLRRSPLTPKNLTSYYSRPVCILLLGKFLSRPSSRHMDACGSRGCFEVRRKGARSLNNKASLWCHPRVNYEIRLCLRVSDYQDRDIVPARRCRPYKRCSSSRAFMLKGGGMEGGDSNKNVFQHRDLNIYGIIHRRKNYKDLKRRWIKRGIIHDFRVNFNRINFKSACVEMLFI